MTEATTIAASRLSAQLLGAGRPSRAEDVVQRVLAVQAQDERAFRLAIRARSSGLSSAAVDDALGIRRTLVVSWLCRGTLHLVGSADYWWLHQITAPRQLTGNASRLRQLGVNEQQTEAAVELILAEVARQPSTRNELGAVLDDAGLPVAGQALIHLLNAASLRAHLVRGPMRGRKHCFVDAERWLERPPAMLGRDELLARLAERYLSGHGPASAQDLATFCGVTLGDARRGLDAIAAHTDDWGDGNLRLRDSTLTDAPPPPRLLGMFDPVLHGWADRSFVLGAYPGVVTSNGMFRATALVRGRVVGTWSMPSGVVTVRTPGPLSRPVRDELAREAQDVLRFLGLAPTDLVVQLL
jgi:winged helix DNA-binding protein